MGLVFSLFHQSSSPPEYDPPQFSVSPSSAGLAHAGRVKSVPLSTDLKNKHSIKAMQAKEVSHIFRNTSIHESLNQHFS